MQTFWPSQKALTLMQMHKCRFATICTCQALLLMPRYRDSAMIRWHRASLQRYLQHHSFVSPPTHPRQHCSLPAHAKAATCPDLAVPSGASHDAAVEDSSTSPSSTSSSLRQHAAERLPSELERLMLDGGRMTSIAQAVWSRFVNPGDHVVDATCGNGWDTRWLAQAVGARGRVVAFDIQEEAIRSARAVLEDEVDPALLPEVQYVQACHSRMQEHVQSVHFVCFNLGFLPGGERSIITQPATTVAALQAAVDILKPKGLISVLCYLGHSGGIEEYEAVRRFAMQLHPGKVQIMEQRILNRPLAPVLILFWKKPMPDEAET